MYSPPTNRSAKIIAEPVSTESSSSSSLSLPPDSLRHLKLKLLTKYLRQSRVIFIGSVFILTCLICAGFIEIYLRLFLPDPVTFRLSRTRRSELSYGSLGSDLNSKSESVISFHVLATETDLENPPTDSFTTAVVERERDEKKTHLKVDAATQTDNPLTYEQVQPLQRIDSITVSPVVDAVSGASNDPTNGIGTTTSVTAEHSHNSNGTNGTANPNTSRNPSATTSIITCVALPLNLITIRSLRLNITTVTEMIERAAPFSLNFPIPESREPEIEILTPLYEFMISLLYQVLQSPICAQLDAITRQRMNENLEILLVTFRTRPQLKYLNKVAELWAVTCAFLGSKTSPSTQNSLATTGNSVDISELEESRQRSLTECPVITRSNQRCDKNLILTRIQIVLCLINDLHENFYSRSSNLPEIRRSDPRRSAELLAVLDEYVHFYNEMIRNLNSHDRAEALKVFNAPS